MENKAAKGSFVFMTGDQKDCFGSTFDILGKRTIMKAKEI